jgi:hypothetical protein
MRIKSLLSIFPEFSKPKLNVIFFCIPQLLFALIYVTKLLSGNQYNPQFLGDPEIMQSLDRLVLLDDPINAILGMHTQPPLLSIVFAISLMLSPHEVIFCQIIWLFVAMVGLLFMQIGILEITSRKQSALFLSCAYAFIPGTLMYSLWSYNTIWVQTFSLILVVSAIKLIRLKSVKKYFFFLALSAVTLYLIRVPFSFILMSFIILGFWFFLWKFKKVKGTYIACIGSILIILTVQYHYFSNFNLLSTSSWTYDQSLRVLKSGLSTDMSAKISLKSECFKEILESGSWAKIQEYPSCENEFPNVANADRFLVSERGNPLNSRERLLGSLAKQEFLVYAIPRNFTSYSKVLLGNGDFKGTIYNSFGLQNFNFTVVNILKYNFITLLFLFALAMFVVIRVFSRTLFISPRKLEALSIFGLLVVISLTLYMNLYALLGETVENDRIRADSNAVTFFSALYLIKSLILNFGSLDFRSRILDRFSSLFRN